MWARGSMRVVPGSVVSSQTSRNKLLHAVEWKIIDTGGAAHTYLPSSIYSHVLESIRDTGYEIDDSDHSSYPSAKECNDHSIHTWPRLEFTVGTVTVTVSPEEYIYIDSLHGECILLLSRDDEQQSSANQVSTLASGLLSRLVTVFDRVNDRVGFCPARHS